MTKKDYAKYIASADWRGRRDDFIEAYEHKCSECELPRWLHRFIYDQDIHVHHLSYANLGNESVDDVSVLCKRCHEEETFGRTDIPKPKTAKCEHCGDNHYDLYSNYCRFCDTLLCGPHVYQSASLVNPFHGRTVAFRLCSQLASTGRSEVLEEMMQGISDGLSIQRQWKQQEDVL